MAATMAKVTTVDLGSLAHTRGVVVRDTVGLEKLVSITLNEVMSKAANVRCGK